MKGKLSNILNLKYIIISGILCILFLSYSIFFILYMTNQNKAANATSLSNAAEQVKISIQKQIQGDFQTLEGIAMCMGSGNLFDHESTEEILSNINADNTFIRMGIASLNGDVNMVDLDGHWDNTFSLSEYDFFQQALEGEHVISNTMPDPLNPNTYINIYCVPIRDTQNQIVAILCAVNQGTILVDIVNTPLVNEKGYSCILNKSGSFEVRSQRLAAGSANSLSIYELGTMDSKQTGYVSTALEQQGTTFYSFQTGKETYAAILLPLGVKDWYLTSFILESELNKNFHATAYGTIALIVVAFFIFSVLFYQQRKIMVKNQQQLYDLAYHDELTGSRNFKRFIIDAENAILSSPSDLYAVWYCDLKRFKYLNDIYGYEAGDQLLKNLCQILTTHCQPRDIFCRVSADNFAGVYFYHDKTQLTDWFQSILKAFRSEEFHTINTSSLDLSAGFFCSEDFDVHLPVEDMVNRANMAQKAAKEIPGSNVIFFSDKLRQQIAQETALIAEAKYALLNNQFVLYFQPKVDIQHHNRLAGAEVLVRWKHPEKGIVPPGIFIPLFEKNGMIIQLDRYIYEQACSWFHDYLSTGRPAINLAINVSRIDLVCEDFVEYYTTIKNKYQIPDNLLELEFTESIFLDDYDLFLQTVTQLQANGITCSLDDFGAGYSSLNVLKNLPMDVLKLDMLFFRHSLNKEREQIVISNVINMAAQLHIKTIAEGVETRDNVEFLTEAGCDIVQGYVFSKPIPMEEFNALLYNNETLIIDYATST